VVGGGGFGDGFGFGGGGLLVVWLLWCGGWCRACLVIFDSWLSGAETYLPMLSFYCCRFNFWLKELFFEFWWAEHFWFEFGVGV
jgi:hypothetical protein